MVRRRYFFAIAVFFLVVFVHGFLHLGVAPGWDPAVYLLNGRTFFGAGVFFDELRPPLVSLLFGAVDTLGFSFFVQQLFALCVRGLAAVLFFRLLIEWVDDLVAAVVAVAAFLHPLVAVVPLFMSEFVSLLFLFPAFSELLRLERSGACSWWRLFFFSMLAFLSRYSLAVFLVPLLVVLFRRRREVLASWRAFLVGLGVGLVPLFVWAAWNFHRFHDPFFSVSRAFFHINFDVVAEPWWFFLWGRWGVLPVLSVFLVAFCAACAVWWRKKEFSLPVFFLSYLVFISLTANKLPRYWVYAVFVAYAAVAVLIMAWPRRRLLFLGLVAAMLLVSTVFFPFMPDESAGGEQCRQVGLVLGERFVPGTVFASTDCVPEIALASSRTTYFLPKGGRLCPYLEESVWLREVDVVVSFEPLDLSCLRLAYAGSFSLYVPVWSDEI